MVIAGCLYLEGIKRCDPVISSEIDGAISFLMIDAPIINFFYQSITYIVINNPILICSYPPYIVSRSNNSLTIVSKTARLPFKHSTAR